MKKRNDDLRLECVNWDEEQPATIKCTGRNHAVSRKVLTKAKHPISLISNEIDRAAELLRQGYEVRLATTDRSSSARSADTASASARSWCKNGEAESLRFENRTVEAVGHRFSADKRGSGVSPLRVGTGEAVGHRFSAN